MVVTGGWLTYVGLVLQLAQGIACTHCTGATIWVAGGAAIIVGVIGFVNEGYSCFVGSTFMVNGNTAGGTYNGVIFMADYDPKATQLVTPGLTIANVEWYVNGQEVWSSQPPNRDLVANPNPEWLTWSPVDVNALSSIYVGPGLETCDLCNFAQGKQAGAFIAVSIVVFHCSSSFLLAIPQQLQSSLDLEVKTAQWLIPVTMSSYLLSPSGVRIMAPSLTPTSPRLPWQSHTRALILLAVSMRHMSEGQ